MRILARFGLGLCGVVLGVASAAQADDSPAPPDVTAALNAQAPGHHHKGLFGWRHCVECQRAWAKKHDGVDVPPPPSNVPAGVVPGQVVHDHSPGAGCAACQAGAVVTGPVTVVESYPPGHAVVGGPAMAANYSAGLCRGGGKRRPGNGRWGSGSGGRVAGRPDPLERTPDGRRRTAAGSQPLRSLGDAFQHDPGPDGPCQPVERTSPRDQPPVRIRRDQPSCPRGARGQEA